MEVARSEQFPAGSDENDAAAAAGKSHARSTDEFSVRVVNDIQHVRIHTHGDEVFLDRFHIRLGPVSGPTARTGRASGMTGGRAAAAEPQKDRFALLSRHIPRRPKAVLPRNLHPARFAGLGLDQLLDRIELVNERLTRPGILGLLGGLSAQALLR